MKQHTHRCTCTHFQMHPWLITISAQLWANNMWASVFMRECLRWASSYVAPSFCQRFSLFVFCDCSDLQSPLPDPSQSDHYCRNLNLCTPVQTERRHFWRLLKCPAESAKLTTEQKRTWTMFLTWILSLNKKEQCSGTWLILIANDDRKTCENTFTRNAQNYCAPGTPSF